MKAILGKKIGMTQIFSDMGEVIPVTVIEAGPCVVTQIKTAKADGYNAVQVGFGATQEKRLNKSLVGHFKKAGPGLFSKLTEFRVDDPAKYTAGQEIKCDIFQPGEYVDVQGVSKGHGFQGVVKRHGFHGGPNSHGQSDKKRAPGSIGAQQPQRVIKGTRMAGRMGGVNVTVQRLEVVKAIPEENALLIRGAVPGAKNSLVYISQTVKRVKAKIAPAPSAKKVAKKEVKKK
jgi:large subunit ribosomal protein L3